MKVSALKSGLFVDSLISVGKPRYMSIEASFVAAAMVVAIYPVATLFGIKGARVLTTSLSLGALVFHIAVLSRVFKERLIETA
jgi:uncharacterized protein YebE (UPF0316 family)